MKRRGECEKENDVTHPKLLCASERTFLCALLLTLKNYNCTIFPNS